MRFLGLTGVLIFLSLSISCYSQQNNSILTDKIPPARLREDATLLRNVVLAMHPSVGIYKNRAYYEQLFNQYIQSLSDSLTLRDFRLRTKLVADELHCGHTEVLYSKKYYKVMSKQKLNYSPYVFLPVQNRVYVFATMDRRVDSTLKRSTEVLSINGIPVDSMLRHCKRFISTDGFNRTAKNHYIQLSFNNFYLSLFGRPDTFSVEYLDGKTPRQLRYPAIQPKSIPPMPLGAKDDSLFTRYKRAKMKHRFLDEEHQT